MKKIKFIMAAVMLLIGATTMQAQSLGDILGGIGKAIVGDKATTEEGIKGTWTYTGPACEFESDNLLAKAGGTAAAAKIENKLSPILKKYVPGIVYTFDGKGNYTTKIKKQTIHGTYTFNSKEKTITFKPKFGKEYTAHVSVQGKEMTLVFNADKLMTILKSISNTTATQSTTAATINALLKSYNGMRLGFKLKK
jgi:hypothetical protein